MTETDQPQPVPLWPLALITLSGTSAMHMFVPALPDAATSLGTSAALVQMTIGIYILGLGLGQLVYGPLADSLGRRPLLLAGLLLFTASGLVAAVAPNVQVQMLVGAACAALVSLHADAALATAGVLVGVGLPGQCAFFMANRSR